MSSVAHSCSSESSSVYRAYNNGCPHGIDLTRKEPVYEKSVTFDSEFMMVNLVEARWLV